MPVIQSTKDKVVVRFYAVGQNPVDAFVNGFHDSQSDAVKESLAHGGNVYTTTKEFSLGDVKDITPTK